MILNPGNTIYDSLRDKIQYNDADFKEAATALYHRQLEDEKEKTDFKRLIVQSIERIQSKSLNGSDKDKIQTVKPEEKNIRDTAQETSETRKTVPNFVDENADGINDNVRNSEAQPVQSRVQKKDRFMDEGEDGINDGRGFHRERRRKGGQGQNNSGGKGRGGPK